jgi:hypothetical protein
MVMTDLVPVSSTAAFSCEDGQQMRGSELALMDTIKAILEILMAAQTVSVDTLEMMLLAQRAKYLPWATPNAEAEMDLLLTFLRDPRRREFREGLRSALSNRQHFRDKNPLRAS